MKVLYVTHGHFWGSTWPYAFIDNYITETLKGLGHQLEVFDLFSRVESVFPFFREVAEKQKLTTGQLKAVLYDRATADLPLQILEFKPDILLHIVGLIPPRVMRAVRELKVKTALWCLDDPQELDFTVQKGLLYDALFTVEPNAVAVHQAAGQKKAFFLPLGFLPSIQKKQAVEDKYQSDLCFIGVPFPARVSFFDQAADFLAEHKVKIIGGGSNIGNSADPWLWKKKLSRLDKLEKFIIDEVISPQEAAKYYNGAKINLNIHRATVDERFEHGNKNKVPAIGVSGRTFEIAGCSAFQLLDDQRTDLSNHFRIGEEVATFHDLADFQKKVAYYLDHEAERAQIAQAAGRRAYADHTYASRLTELLARTVG